eukprot:m.101742 g.101742  ORF g.101742 m.101742 type:complete len:88 (-) comp15182_c0_seq9:1067-1330(-)
MIGFGVGSCGWSASRLAVLWNGVCVKRQPQTTGSSSATDVAPNARGWKKKEPTMSSSGSMELLGLRICLLPAPNGGVITNSYHISSI